MDFFIKGLILGFSIAAPVGPIGILCIRRTLAEGRMHGFVSGLGAATADGVYGAIAAFGLTAVSGFLLTYGLPVRVIGMLFIVYLAVSIFFSKPRETETGSNIVKVLRVDSLANHYQSFNHHFFSCDLCWIRSWAVRY